MFQLILEVEILDVLNDVLVLDVLDVLDILDIY